MKRQEREQALHVRRLMRRRVVSIEREAAEKAEAGGSLPVRPADGASRGGPLPQRLARLCRHPRYPDLSLSVHRDRVLRASQVGPQGSVWAGLYSKIGMPQNPNDAMWTRVPGSSGCPRARARSPAGHGGVMVELASGPGMSPVAALDVARRLDLEGFTLDEDFGATPLGGSSDEQTYVVRGHVAEEEVVTALEKDPRVVKVWRDTPVAPF